jgi:hypothetical protein
MKTESQDVLDPSRSQLRALAATLDRHVSDLSNQAQVGETSQNLKLAWLALSKALALGPEPTLRSCPKCNRRIPREATRCRYCMTQSAPAPSADVEAQR